MNKRVGGTSAEVLCFPKIVEELLHFAHVTAASTYPITHVQRRSSSGHTPISDRKHQLEEGRLIAFGSDIGPLLLAYSGAGVSDFPKPPALCLKADLAEVVQFH